MKTKLSKLILFFFIQLTLLLTTEVFADEHVSFIDQSVNLQGFDRFENEGISGVAWLDYDVDGDLDLFIPNYIGAKNGLFENLGNGKFYNVIVGSGLDNINGYSAVVAGDIDNDGCPDIYLLGSGGILNMPSVSRLFHNNCDGTFTDISRTSNTQGTQSDATSVMADFNNDGFLDIFVTGKGLGHAVSSKFNTENRIYINNKDLTFTQIAIAPEINDDLGSCVAITTDYDDDGWIDILVADCLGFNGSSTPFHLYINNKDNTFTDIAKEVGLTKAGYWMSLTLGDYDNDGDMDIFAANGGSPQPTTGRIDSHVLYRKNDDGTYTDVTPIELSYKEFTWGASFADWDNDGDIDLYYVGEWLKFGFAGAHTGNPSYMFFNDGKGNFIEDTEVLNINMDKYQISGVARADYDGDGFLDLLVVKESFQMFDPQIDELMINVSGKPTLYKNLGNDNNWLQVRLQGHKSNSMGIGAKLKLYTHSGSQTREISAGSSFHSTETPWPTFGMGDREQGILEVKWPCGDIEFYNVKANSKVIIQEKGGIKKPGKNKKFYH